jgi:hypothetical protein
VTRLDDWGSIPARDRDFSLRHRVQTGSETHSGSYPIGTVVSFDGVKAIGK